ncbi:DUF6597 domain-containing transcriptional factor [Micromonospora sp. NPDC049497]|uniref:DUF6597 domain-containing transcriptional factor n=1 Tax=Micromonospora sp. NPDC049497 TaxID=3364273 RepID=UPI003791D258
MRQPRTDNRGILDPARLRRRVRFRRHLPAAVLRRHVEHYWLVDWDLSEPFTQHVVPHPAVNVVFERDGDGPVRAEVAGVGLELSSVTLAGVGTVSGVQFRPGGFRPFWPGPWPSWPAGGCRSRRSPAAGRRPRPQRPPVPASRRRTPARRRWPAPATVRTPRAAVPWTPC